MKNSPHRKTSNSSDVCTVSLPRRSSDARVDTALRIRGADRPAQGSCEDVFGRNETAPEFGLHINSRANVILLDEPTAGVDPQSRNHLFESIERLKSEGTTVLYTTHYMEEAALCDRVAIMDHGAILDIDAVDTLIERHGGESVVRAELQTVPDDPTVLPPRYQLDGLSLRFQSHSPLEEIGRLSNSGVSFRTLEIGRPDLETVFLALTGRSLRRLMREILTIAMKDIKLILRNTARAVFHRRLSGCDGDLLWIRDGKRRRRVRGARNRDRRQR